MTCDIEVCENTDWAFGQVGTCNNITGVCECPQGYSGKDNWREFNDCHINDAWRNGINIVLLLTTIITILVQFSALAYLGMTIRNSTRKMPPFQPIGMRRNSFSSRANSQHSEHVETHTAMVRNLQRPGQLSRRQYRILRIIILLTLFPCFGLVVNINNIQNPTRLRYQIPYLSDIALSLSAACLFCGFWALLYLYYTSLPDLVLLGKLLNLQSIFISYPQGMYWLSISHMLTILISTFLSLGLLPSIYRDSPEFRASCDRFFLISAVFFMLEYAVLFNAISYVIARLYREALEIADHYKTSIDLNKVKTGLKWVRIYAMILPICIFTGVLPFIIMIVPFGYLAALLACLFLTKEFVSDRSHTLRDVIRRSPQRSYGSSIHRSFGSAPGTSYQQSMIHRI